MANNVQFQIGAAGFEKLCSFRFLESLQVEKYKSKTTGVTLCFVDVPGPLVNGFFTLGKTIENEVLHFTVKFFVSLFMQLIYHSTIILFLHFYCV